MYEVLQRLLFERHAFLPLFLCLEARLAPFVAVGQSRNVAPAALQDHGAVVGGVFDRLDRGQRVAGRAARKNLARHDLRAGDAAPAAGDRADADAVVVLRGDYARHMRAVAGVVDVVPRDDARVLDEVVAVDVALIAVAVVILVRAVDFVLVDPHVVLQVGVLDHHALVEDGHDDRLVARREFPRLLALHVGVHDGFPAEHVAAVHEVPLLRKQQVVEGIGRGFARPGRALVLDGFERLAGEGHRLFPGVVGAVDGAVEADVLHFAQRREFLGDLGGGELLAEADHVPQVQFRFAGALLVARVHGEDALDLITADDVQNLIDGENARTGRGAAAAGDARPVEYVAYVRCEFHQHLPRLVFGRDVRARSRLRGGQLLFGTCGKCQ